MVPIFNHKHANGDACLVNEMEERQASEKSVEMTFTVQGMRDNQHFSKPGQVDDGAFEAFRAQLYKELVQVDRKQVSKGLSLDGWRVLQCQRWVIRGVLSHNFNMTILQGIAEKHKRIGVEPSGYFYPELYAKVVKKLDSDHR